MESTRKLQKAGIRIFALACFLILNIKDVSVTKKKSEKNESIIQKEITSKEFEIQSFGISNNDLKTSRNQVMVNHLYQQISDEPKSG